MDVRPPLIRLCLSGCLGSRSLHFWRDSEWSIARLQLRYLTDDFERAIIMAMSNWQRLCSRSLIVVCLAASLVALAPFSFAQDHWVGTWSTAVVVRPAPASAATAAPAGRGGPRFELNNQTLRQIVHVSLGGQRARVVLSNVFGAAPLQVDAADVALHDQDAKIAAGSAHPLTFGGRTSVTIPTGAEMFSDPVSLAVAPMSDLVVDLYLPQELTGATLTTHGGANQTNYISDTGNHAGAADFPVKGTTPSWFFLERVEVTAAPQVGAIVTFGDSITDGTRSTANTNNRWPDHLAKRLLAKPGDAHGILNQAIAGNRLLTEAIVPFGINALARFDRDVLAQTGVTHVVVLEGINDIGMAREGPARRPKT